jgi:hypothetical protein
MSQYYNPNRMRSKYSPQSDEPFRLSRAKLDVFLNCPRCFYLDARLGTARPPSMPFNLNSAVDLLLKKEFDVHRAQKTAHPLMKHYGIDAVPFAHEHMDLWREALRGGVRYIDPVTNFEVTGAPDDLWVNSTGALHVVDYKATSKDGEVSLDAPWQIGYKRQIEVYQWLLRKNDFTVDPVGYFVYCNGKRDREAFDGKLEFDISVIAYTGDDAWVDHALRAAKTCLDADILPLAGEDCDWCSYREAASRHEQA